MRHLVRSILVRVSLALVLGAGASSCLGVPIPIPPPMAQVQALTDCDGSVECPAGGVLVDVEGFAVPGALVVIENSTRQLSNGIAFSASGFAARAPIADAGGDAGVTASGRYFIRLGPARATPGGPVTISQRGDRLSVRQFVEGEGGRYEASNDTVVIVR